MTSEIARLVWQSVVAAALVTAVVGTMARLRHEAAVTIAEWNVERRHITRPLAFPDPFTSIVEYREAISRYRVTGAVTAWPPLQSD